MRKFILLFVWLIVGLALIAPVSNAQYQTGCGNNSLQDPGNEGSSDEEDKQPDPVGDPVDPQKANLHRDVTDITVWGPAPITFARNLNSRTTDFNDPYWELGYKQTWQHNWNYEVRQLTTKTYNFFDIKVRYPDGNDVNFKATDISGAQLAPPANNGDRLHRWPGTTVGYTLVRPDGSEYDFWRYLSPKFHLTQVRNGLGFSWTCTYDSNQQLTKITNNFGRWIQITHETGPDGVRRISSVSTSDGRAVTYGYSQWATSGKYVLTSVNYPGAEQAAYTYVTADPNNSAARPLLSTAFDPKSHGGAQMKYTYNYNAISFGSIITGTVLENRNAVTDQTIVRLPLGGGSYPQILYGNGTEVTRQYTNGLISARADGAGRTVTFTRDQGGYGFVNSRTEAASGAVTSYVRDTAGHILSRTDALGNTRTNTYNAKGFLLTSTDELGHQTTITRDSNNRPTRVDYQDTSHESWTYNSSGQPLTHQLRNGGTESFAYDASGNMTSRTDALGNVTAFTYNPNGTIASATDARLNTSSFIYNWRGALASVTHADGTARAYSYDTFGNRSAVTDELGHVTSYTYDEFNRITTATDPLGRTVTYEYGAAPDVTASSYMNRISRVILPSGNKIEYTYDGSRKRTSQTIGAGTSDAATTLYSYDDAGNMIAMTDPRGRTWSYSYDLRHLPLSITDPLNHTTSWEYDDRGNKISETRPDGGVTTYVYDDLNRLISSTDPKGQTTSYQYGGTGVTDFGNNLVKLTDARGNAYLFTYDVWGHKTAMIYPDGSHENWTYDAAGNVLTYTTRAGQVKTSTYDNLNRLTAIDWSDSTPDVTMTYDAVGRLLTMNNGVSALSYTYNDANQLTSETQNITGAAGPAVVGYSYSADGTRATMTYPDGQVLSYAYTGRNQLGSISVNGAAPLVTYGYDGDGKLISKALENGTATTYTYDDAARLTQVKHVKDATVLAQFDYALDAVGNRTQKAVNGAMPNRTENYGYDAVDQLVSADYGPRAETFEYDAAGNRVSVADSASGTTDYTANNLNQYTGVGATTPVYDSNGNLSAYSPWSYTYDAGNRLLTAGDGTTSAGFAYDGLNRQVARTISGVTTYLIYDGWNLIAEYDSSGALQAKYIHGVRTDEILAKIDSSGSTVYYHHDGLGSTTALTNAAGALLESYHYDAFGKPTIYNASGSVITATAYANRFMFSGREYLAQLGLYDYRNRFYSHVLGRFLQTDPLRFGAGDANIYRYAGNNIANFTDPFGLMDINPFSGGLGDFNQNNQDFSNLGENLPPPPDVSSESCDGGGGGGSGGGGGGSGGSSEDESTNIFERVVGLNSHGNGVTGRDFAGAAVGILAGPLLEGAQFAEDEAAASQSATSLQYSPEVLAKAAEDPLFHNYPSMFDETIMQEGDIMLKNNYTQYNLQGSINDYNGEFQLGLDPNGIVTHRVFIPNKP
jgi:RHS repeat-associated protein